ncbi:hypothetical protein [Salinilacihabitans rarus]|uniref:hypothetical protein n=1 Tax=Salinilacihabitans rarus TaxID=2961596 RepID=UPI0020C88479|nr:hypothetical protein [Salinilacihabitans rarus]
MSHAATGSELEEVSRGIRAGVDRLTAAIEGGASERDLSETATEFWEVVEAAAALLGTVDLAAAPDVVDPRTIPEAVDAAAIPAAIAARDPDRALDVRPILQAVELRELWNAVDLVEFARAKRRLDVELADVVDVDGASGSADSDVARDLDEFAAENRTASRNAAVQQQARKRVGAARAAAVDAHVTLESAYDANRSRRRSRNPTAVSLRSPGPLPASSSAAFSTVPATVRGAAVDAPPRLYGRRWRDVRRERESGR